MALYDELPLTSVLSPKMMKRAQALLTGLAEIRAEEAAAGQSVCERLGLESKDELKQELESIQLSFDLPGLRHGNLAFASVESKGRQILSKEKLLLAGVTAKVIEKCTETGAPYRVKNLKVQTEKGWE